MSYRKRRERQESNADSYFAWIVISLAILLGGSYIFYSQCHDSALIRRFIQRDVGMTYSQFIKKLEQVEKLREEQGIK